MRPYRPSRKERGQGLAEIIVICVIVLFIALVSLRVMKKKMEVPADLDPGHDTSSLDGVSDTKGSADGTSSSSTSPSELIEGTKDKMEQTKRTIPEDLREDDGDIAGDDSEE